MHIKSSAPRPPVSKPATKPTLTSQEKRRAEELTSLFENSTTTLQYGYAENIHDGRGITAGRAGFTSGTDDMWDVVRDYTKKKPNNPLAKFLPRLAQLHALPDDSKERGSTKGLEGLVAAWKEAAKDPAFRAVQDAAVDRMYFKPSQAHVRELGLTTPLAQGELYDAIIQHGDGDDADGLPALIAATNAKAGGTPKSGVDEKTWLGDFLEVRKADLAHAHDPATRKEWAESVDRVGVYQDLLDAGNLDLRGPITVHHGDFDGTVK
jgi:hypothetical protein